MLTKNRIPLLIALICCLEVSIYLWADWTSTFNKSNFFAIHSAFIFDKCARIAARISSALILLMLSMVGYNGLKKIYAEDKKRELFFILLILFTCNHLVHLLFVILRFRSHGESINIDEPIGIGGTVHGIITFGCIIIIPFILWNIKHLHKFIYYIIIFHLLNISCFIIKTFLGKIKPPEHPAYHNQLGIVVIVAACFYMLYRVYMENSQNTTTNN